MSEDSLLSFWIREALCAGFTHAAPLNASTLAPRAEVRGMCAKCHMYGRNWACPPFCGDLPALEAKLRSYRAGLLVQTVGELEDAFDGEGMMAAEARHKARFAAMTDALRVRFPTLLALSAGCCTRCETCGCPDAPCRFPDAQTSSMEAFGLLVSEVCRQNGIGYYYGPGTISFVSCWLLN